MGQTEPTKFKFSLFLSLVRALFPRWNFFDQVSYQFVVEIKPADQEPWHRVHFTQRRSPFSFFINPNHNLAMAQVNVVEHFAQDIQKLQGSDLRLSDLSLLNLTSYQLLKSVLSIKAFEIFGNLNTSYQFKILAYNSKEILDVYVSNPICWEAT